MNRGQWHSQVCVSVNVQLFVAAPTGAGEQTLKAQEQARRKIYEMATRECAVLLNVMASDCKLENINVNINRYCNPSQPNGFALNGRIRYRITQK